MSDTKDEETQSSDSSNIDSTSTTESDTNLWEDIRAE